jgi:hypothetical protein
LSKVFHLAHGGNRWPNDGICAGERKAIQSFHPSDFTTAFGRAEGFSRRSGSGATASRALMMHGEGSGVISVTGELPLDFVIAALWAA